MEIYYDTEFFDTGALVHLLSIGMVREDGQEYYAIVDDPSVLRLAANNSWLKENVLAYFPLVQPIDINYPVWDESHIDYKYVKPKSLIAKEVRDFVVEFPNPSLWAYFSAYDHLCLSQLYGRMLDMPIGMPQRTNDICQEANRLGKWFPRMPGLEQHNALSDAQEVKFRREWLKAYDKQRFVTTKIEDA